MIIQSKQVYIATQFIPAQIEIEDTKIKAVYPYNTHKVDVDYNELRIVPGFYDVHCHGYHGFDTNHGTHEGLKIWLKEIVREGVCGLLPTTITQSFEELEQAVRNVYEVSQLNPEGAQILGIHFEGPFLDMVYKGAQPPEHIRKATIEEFEKYQKACNGMIKIITLAPEHDEDFKLTRHCANNGVNVSIGHSGATYDEAIMAIANGARGFTHTYNGMSPFNHRDNGVVGASFRAHDIYSEIICDGNHSTYAALNIFFKNKASHALLITDALMCKGYNTGDQFEFGGHMIEIYKDGSAHLLEGKKSLAGSTLKMNEGLKILVEKCNVPFEDALASCTINPCKYLKIDDHKGYIRQGYDGDLVVLNDDYSVVQTYCNGKAMI